MKRLFPYNLFDVFPHNLIADVLIDEDSVESILSYYENYPREEIDKPHTFLLNRVIWDFEGEIDFYVHEYSVANCWDPFYYGIVFSKTQGDTFIYISKPENGKRHMLMVKNMIGWNEE